jgi:hypothetical protein
MASILQIKNKTVICLTSCFENIVALSCSKVRGCCMHVFVVQYITFVSLHSPLAVASSPSGSENTWHAVGAIQNGTSIFSPRMVVDMSMEDTFLRTRGRSRNLSVWILFVLGLGKNKEIFEVGRVLIQFPNRKLGQISFFQFLLHCFARLYNPGPFSFLNRSPSD